MREGDTFGRIAGRFGVSMNDLKRANPAVHPERLKIGLSLSIPTKTVSTQPASPAPGGYTVRAGDNDFSIAKRLGVSAIALHAANPGVNWRRLQIGQALRVPGKSSSVASSAGTAPPKASGGYKVRSGDNDWVIARRVGTTPANLRKLNPGVNWTRLQIGQALNVPGGSTATVAAAIRTKHVKVAKDNVILRRKPSTQSDRVAMVEAGKLGSIVDRENGWYKLRLSGGTLGWVRGDLLKPVSAAEVAKPKTVAKAPTRRSPIVREDPKQVASLKSAVRGNTLLETAARYKGVRYRYGGTTSRGFDCSGFVSHVFKTQGVRLPRTSREQATVGRSVAKSDLKKGDLVFFKTRGSRISHVGIYIGGGKFIHSSSGGGRVKTDSLNDGYYSRRYAGARRVARNVEADGDTPASRTPVRVAAAAAEKQTAPPPAPEPQRRVTVGTDEISR